MIKLFLDSSFIALGTPNELLIHFNNAAIHQITKEAEINNLLKYVFFGDKQKKKLILAHSDINWLYQKTEQYFDKVFCSAGGVVKSHTGKILLIFRQNHWDLPKGKIDEGETPEQAALREVEEETGLSKGVIIRQLPNSYHIFHDPFKRVVLKKNIWFEMEGDDNQKLIPQIEEDITRVEWAEISQMNKYFTNMWPSIVDVVKNALNGEKTI